MVCVRKPNLLAYRGDVRKPGDSAGRVQEGPAGLGLRTKTEFIGFHGRRARTGGAPPEQIPGAPATKVRARKPNSLAFRAGEREPGKPLEQIQGAPAAKVRARKPNLLTFTAGEREPGKPLEQIPDAPAAKVRARKPNLLTFTAGEREPGAPAQQIPGARRAGGREAARPGSEGAGRTLKKTKTLNRPTETSADSKFFHYILHPIYKEETYSFSPRAKRRMVRPTPSSSLLSAT